MTNTPTVEQSEPITDRSDTVPKMLEVTGLGHTYAGSQQHTAIGDVSFDVESGQLACIVGPSGCGKSTLLRCLASLIAPSRGEVRMHGDLVRGVPEDLAVVFQDYSRSLFPWMSVRGNIEFPLRSRGIGKSERRERAEQTLRWVGLAGSERKYPWQLSGGMQQRVAIARALACRPALLLMDEPFASVDAQTRFELEDLLLQVRKEQDTTILLVTHDIDESVYLSDRVLVLSKSPASIVADLPVELGEDRDQISTRESETFVQLRGEIARLLRNREQQADSDGSATNREPSTEAGETGETGDERGSGEAPQAPADRTGDTTPDTDTDSTSTADSSGEAEPDSGATLDSETAPEQAEERPRTEESAHEEEPDSRTESAEAGEADSGTDAASETEASSRTAAVSETEGGESEPESADSTAESAVRESR
ncbi:ABC-type nitrate/sulfonate/bicarbonate transport system, ATPase component [Actinopolyspora mzabensis]|uniref:ABC-type nitrate/sulfonate/bicarbonate transport system, ATPase component n=1 Tax=Actinopolyspora mzabensis TaxID=995066 RepID=A0A1G9C559_ACTMZ|nr:ATP-binding cassette domain-containing protein [Actinopolyspora mzabensis]SDK46534.1 ABC-type nitrate/sulfonate/bicarbonate transport system, ATPase component [Actinopolyspora mzabensis]